LATSPVATLVFAASRGYSDLVKTRISDSNINLNIIWEGRTVLMAAAEAGRTECVELLLSNPNVDPNVINDDGETALLHC
jgi:ankyrin repeat protein